MIRWLFWLHRYLGIAVGVLMVMWCVSGVVMMYVGYPALDSRVRLSRLAPIVWSGCCRISSAVLADTDPVGDFGVEMLAGRPVMEVRGPPEAAGLIDLTTGSAIEGVSSGQAAEVAAAYSTGLRHAVPRLLGTIDYDQWTVTERGGPLYHFRLDDGSGTELYVSSTTGEVVQLTTERQRFWNWLGSVPHWLYFADLRRQPALWTQVVIVTSMIGCFLTAIGLYIGAWQWLHRPAGRWSPYRGFNLWHHLVGLVFGIFTLTWVFSGLLSVNPWGWLEGAGARPERVQLRGPQISAAQVRDLLRALAAVHPPGIVSIASAPLDGRLYVVASAADGQRQRLDGGGAPAPLAQAELAFIGKALSGTAQAPTLMRREDNYYFGSPQDAVPLPVYRIIRRDGSNPRYYVDPISGMLIAKVDRGDRGYRWWFDGLHRMDFVVALRGRPQWDVLMLLLMSGVTTVCVTGAYLGYRRLTR
ncbi:MAG TPA: hypothetical protein VHX52_10055 [Steroidobacteraceae bacterium]|jgi:hypothetical protein|nr:hypothetical protein [Steroidobacteraceae bacterium]